MFPFDPPENITKPNVLLGGKGLTEFDKINCCI